MVDGAAADGGVSYGSLVSDPVLLSVFLISSTGLVGVNAVPAALPSIASALGLGEAGVGLVMSAHTLPLIALVPITGILADIYGRRRVVLPSLFLLGTAGLATLAVTDFRTLLALRVLQGVAVAGIVPLSATLIGDLYTGASGSAAQGIRSGLNGLASAIAPVIAGFLAVIAWQYPFLLYGLAFPTLVVVYFTYPETLDRDADRSNGILSTLRVYWGAIRREAADRAFGLFLAGGFAVFFAKQAVKTFVPVFVTASLGASVTTAGLVLGFYGVMRAVTAPFAGTVLARFGRRATLLAAVVSSAAGTALIPFTGGVPALVVAVGLYTVGEAIFNPVLNDATAAFAAAEHRGGLMSGMGMFKTVGITASPAILGAVIAVSGYRTGFLLAAGVVAVYAVALGFLTRPAGGAGLEF